MITREKQDREWTVDRWRGLYAEGWGSNIVSEAFSHPAKFRPALIRKIYEHMAAEGWLKPGDQVLDPFAGVALGALHAMHNGLVWIGVELEQRFCDVGAGLDCTGISAADWVRFYGRWARAAHLEGRAWCPRCLAEAGQVDEAPPLARLIPALPSASYRRNSGQIPSTVPHHYTGNLDLWRAMGLPGSARLLQGDSRKLLQVLRGEIEGCVSSPPYAEGCQHTGGPDKHPEHIEGGKRGVAIGYEAAVSSPPYADSMERPGGIDPSKSVHVGGPYSQMNRSDTRYGGGEGQLGAMPEGEFSAAISSPPFEDAVGSDDPDKRGGLYRDPKRRADVNLVATYGETEGQLGAMRGGYEAAVSSPPYAASVNAGSHGIDWSKIGPQAGNRRRGEDCKHGQTLRDQLNYGSDPDPAQLGAMPEGEFDAAVSSPPFGAAETRDQSPYQGGYVGDMMGRAYTQGRQGETDGNLGQMETRSEDFEGVVSSPPYEESLDRGTVDATERRRLARSLGVSNAEHISPIDMENIGERTQPDYGRAEGQLGAEEGETFWSAARTIVAQVYAALAPGAHAAWITKAFVRDGKRVDFPGQWRQLCEAVGFVTLHEHHAMLTEDKGTQLGFFEDEHLITERKSFFRRLAERKGSPRIDYEVVWCMVKPGDTDANA